MASAPTTRLLEVEPDLGRYLDEEERAAAESLAVPVATLSGADDELDALLDDRQAFSAIVLHGVVLHQIRLGDQPTLRVLGPGDIAYASSDGTSGLAFDSARRASPGARVALLGDEIAAATRRWPGLLAGLHARTAEQCERLLLQTAICQMPRVADRLLSMFWLLAETWGRVTPLGTVVSLELTHDTLGALVGARRPTVTLALGELTERGAVVRQGRGWLLLELPEPPSGPTTPLETPHPVEVTESDWEDADTQLVHLAHTREALRDAVSRLRAEHVVSRQEARERLAEMAQARARSRELRRALTKNRPPPS